MGLLYKCWVEMLRLGFGFMNFRVNCLQGGAFCNFRPFLVLHSRTQTDFARRLRFILLSAKGQFELIISASLFLFKSL